MLTRTAGALAASHRTDDSLSSPGTRHTTPNESPFPMLLPQPPLPWVFIWFGFFKTESHYVARLAWNSRSSCLSLWSARITGVHHHLTQYILYHKQISHIRKE
jgi:hypothetical protein